VRAETRTRPERVGAALLSCGHVWETLSHREEMARYTRRTGISVGRARADRCRRRGGSPRQS
jgi:hypothetical protein